MPNPTDDDPDPYAVGPEVVEPGDAGPAQPRRSRRRRRIVAGVLAGVLVIVLATAGGAWWYINRLSSSVERIPGAFNIPETARPTEVETDGDAITFLLGGLDGEDSADVYEPGAARTDTIMLAHFPDGRDRGYLVSIPRDTYVDIPDHGQNKINAAYSLGGPALFVQTIEQLTGMRVNHLVLIDWNGFEELTDELGGVSLTFDEPTVLADGTTLPAGTHTLDGATALQYVRDRKDLPAGDFDRVRRQQNFLRALVDSLVSSGDLTDPRRVDDVVGAIGQAARVDEELSAFGMVRLGLSLAGLHAEDMTFLTVPTSGTDDVGGQSIVVYDDERAAELWAGLQADTIEGFLTDNPDLVTGDDVN